MNTMKILEENKGDHLLNLGVKASEDTKTINCKREKR